MASFADMFGKMQEINLSMPGKTVTVLHESVKNPPFIRKLINVYWLECVGKEVIDCFILQKKA